MLKIKFLSLVIVLNLFACTFAGLVDNGSKQMNSKGDAESSSNSKKEDKNRFAAPFNELENARTHFSKPSFLKPFIGGGSGHQQGFPSISSLIPQLIHKPFNIIHPPVAPVAPAPSLYVEPTKPVAPIFPQIFSPPIFPKPHLPVASKPTFVVSQQVIHKPVVTEKIEIIRRPVYSEVVEVVHKPILSEVQQVIKHPTYVEHVVKKPLVTAIKNEFQGSPVHLPSQQYELHDKPQHVQPVTTEVVQIPHQQVPVGSGYGFDSGYKPSYGVSAPLVTGSYGIGSEIVGLGSSPSYVSGYGPSYGLGSGYGSTYGSGSGYGSSYGLGSGYGSSYGSGSGYGSSYGLGSGYGSSYVLGSGYGSSYGLGSGHGSTYGLGSGYGSSYGLGSGYGSSYGLGSGYGSSYGSNYVKPSYGQESTGVEHTYVEPATSCKNNECKPVLSEDDLSLNENLEAVYSPTAWYYASAHLDNGRNVYEQSPSPSPGYYYMVPQETSEEPQNSKLDDFMNNPSTKVKVEALYNEYRQTIANDKQSVGQSREVAGNDDRNGIMEEDMKKQMMNMADDEKVEQVMHTVKTATGPMLEKIEEQIRKRQNEIEKSESKSKSESSTTQDAMQTQTTKMN